MLEEVIQDRTELVIDIMGMAELSRNNKEAFAIARKNGLGASDSSVILGVNKWKTVDELIKEKATPGITDAEIAIGKKASVRKGADLEEFILKKFQDDFADKYSMTVHKPDAQFRFEKCPSLTVNFDGVMQYVSHELIPVEAKVVTKYAQKYWNKANAITDLIAGQRYMSGGTLENHIEQQAQLYGIPPYYYTQIQQQLMGLDSLYGYMPALFDDEWTMYVFKIYSDDFVFQALKSKAPEVWNLIEELRKGVQ